MATDKTAARSAWNMWEQDGEPISDADAIQFVVNDPGVFGDMLRAFNKLSEQEQESGIGVDCREALTHYVAALKEAEPEHYKILEEYGCFKNVFPETR